MEDRLVYARLSNPDICNPHEMTYRFARGSWWTTQLRRRCSDPHHGRLVRVVLLGRGRRVRLRGPAQQLLQNGRFRHGRARRNTNRNFRIMSRRACHHTAFSPRQQSSRPARRFWPAGEQRCRTWCRQRTGHRVLYRVGKHRGGMGRVGVLCKSTFRGNSFSKSIFLWDLKNKGAQKLLAECDVQNSKKKPPKSTTKARTRLARSYEDENTTR
ncbi:hypothetical protein C8R47DRAFT_81225 [Mycena vitilis]|nr:hypothetical protein C8R47DRAFT_81225 [Mycena vitilis]